VGQRRRPFRVRPLAVEESILQETLYIDLPSRRHRRRWWLLTPEALALIEISERPLQLICIAGGFFPDGFCVSEAAACVAATQPAVSIMVSLRNRTEMRRCNGVAWHYRSRNPSISTRLPVLTRAPLQLAEPCKGYHELNPQLEDLILVESIQRIGITT
jgi:hypothetical protein